MASEETRVVVLDGANQFNPYMVSSFARRVLIPPEKLLKGIQIARAFTCYQMAALMGEKLAVLLEQEGMITRGQKPWVVLLGPITTFLDEDVPERESRPLFERSLRRIEELSEEGVPFFLFQSCIPIHVKRRYFMGRLLQFANLVLRIALDDEGCKVVLEKEPTESQITNGQKTGRLGDAVTR